MIILVSQKFCSVQACFLILDQGCHMALMASHCFNITPLIQFLLEGLFAFIMSKVKNSNIGKYFVATNQRKNYSVSETKNRERAKPGFYGQSNLQPSGAFFNSFRMSHHTCQGSINANALRLSQIK